MKKIVAMLVALMLAVGCFGAMAEGAPLLAGGWLVCEDGVMTEDAQAAFDKAIGDVDFAEIKAVRLLGTQVVAGINYSILALSKYEDGQGGYSVLTIYADLSGNATVEAEQFIELGIPALDDTDAEEMDGQNPAMNFIGPWADKISQRATLTVNALEKNDALFEVAWSDSAEAGTIWTLYCTYDAESGKFVYTEGARKEYTCDENGNMTYGEITEGLKGEFVPQEDGTIGWTTEDGVECVFEFAW